MFSCMSEIFAVFSMKYQKVLSYKNAGVTHKKVHTIFSGIYPLSVVAPLNLVVAFFFSLLFHSNVSFYLFIFFLQTAIIPFLTVSLVDMTASRDTAIVLHYVFVFLLPPYPVFGALYYIDSVSINTNLSQMYKEIFSHNFI